MRGNELLDKMELIDPAYVEEAEVKVKKKKGAWVKWGAMAACLCIMIVGALTIGQQDNPQPPDFAELKPITIPALNAGGMGFEGYMCYDISDLITGNPWDESMKIAYLPVYKNGAYDSSGAGVPKGLSEAEMMKRLEFVVSALGLEVISTEVITGEFIEDDEETLRDENLAEIHAETNNGKIYIQADGNIVYFLPDEGLVLPDQLNFTHSSTTDAEAKKVLFYLTSEYSDLLNFENPAEAFWEDYNIYGEFNRRYKVYDAAGDDSEDILNYNFHCVRFSPNEMGNLEFITINDGLLLAEKLGEYPIITAKEATKRLISGNYQTSVPVEFSGKKFIKKVELVYRTGSLEEVLLPYYRFYVQLPDAMNASKENGDLKTYGAYYVPAVVDEYVANMPTYDGSFN